MTPASPSPALRPLRTRSALVAFACMLTSCVAYDPESTDLAAERAALPRLSGRVSFVEAVERTFANDPSLLALAAEARAAGLDLAAWEGQGQLQDRRMALMLDPVAMLGLLQRGEAVGVRDARGAQAALALTEARWRAVEDLASAVAELRALGEAHVVAIEVDAAPFERAGLAGSAHAAQLRAAVATAAAERSAIAAEREALLARIRRRLGVAADSPVAIDAPLPEWPPAVEASAERVLARPDLAVALARYRTADAEFRAAVAAQYPSLVVGPDTPVRGGVVDPMAVLRLPFGGGGAAEAARERRSAARNRVVDGLLLAEGEARAAIEAEGAAVAVAEAATAAALASRTSLAAARAGLDVEVDAFARVAETAAMAVRDAKEARAAAQAAARARVRRAVACGWPAEGDLR